MSTIKPYDIPKSLVVEAWKRVKRNKGGAGIDNQSIEDFENRLKDNLYKIWNRMSSGTYFPPPVKTVSIPKRNGGKRYLGIPSVSDRVAQMVAKIRLEQAVEGCFHQESYGSRPHKSALDAIEITRQRCWKFDWLLEFDIKGMFDNIDRELLSKAVRHHTNCKWLILYIERWLKSSIQDEDGVTKSRSKGVAQGSVISPVLSNLFMHYAFDKWMERTFPKAPFCRYADDGIVHCRSYEEACRIKKALKNRLEECKLEMHVEKSRIVCCNPTTRKRPKDAEKKFVFLGYEFRPRLVRSKYGKIFTGFTPAISPKAQQSIRDEIRSWKIYRWTPYTLDKLATFMRPRIQGWINYYGHFQLSSLKKVLRYIDLQLLKWVKRKYRKRGKYMLRARIWLGKIAHSKKWLFPHWKIGVHFPAE